MIKKEKKVGTEKTKLYKRLTLTIVLGIIITVITAPIIIFYGPFENIKSTAVGTLYTSLSHRGVIEFLLSDEAIERINGKQGFYQNDTGTINKLDYKINHSNKIDFVKIDGGNLRLKGYMLVIHDPTTVKVGYSDKLPVEGEYTSDIAKRFNAIAAINAGGFNYNGAWASTGGEIEGYIIHDGKVICNNLKNKSDGYNAIGFSSRGQLIFGNYTVNRLKEIGVNEAVCFDGPKLIVNGKKMFKPNENGGLGINPRTAIGQKATGEILFLVIDGRGVGSVGAYMYDIQEILFEQGAVNAINLDGGSSSAMYYNNKLVNNPSNAMGERKIPSIFMVLPTKGN